MLPRAIARLGSGARSRPLLSTHKDFYSWEKAVPAPRKHSDVGSSKQQRAFYSSTTSSNSSSSSSSPNSLIAHGDHPESSSSTTSTTITSRRADDSKFAPQPTTVPRPLTYTTGGKRTRRTSAAQHQLSTGPAPLLAQEGDEEEGGVDESDRKMLEVASPPAAAGLRPETAAASTPVDLGCKAYYMARSIDIKTVCKVWCGAVHVSASVSVIVFPPNQH